MIRESKILVVDDESGIRNILYEVLTGVGYQVTVAKDGEESLVQLNGKDFDLLITDLDMPRLDGIGLLQKMKREGRKEKVIIMTGGTPVDQDRLEGEILPVYAQLLKPFQLITFLETVASVLARKKQKKKAAHLN